MKANKYEDLVVQLRKEPYVIRPLFEYLNLYKKLQKLLKYQPKTNQKVKMAIFFTPNLRLNASRFWLIKVMYCLSSSAMVGIISRLMYHFNLTTFVFAIMSCNVRSSLLKIKRISTILYRFKPGIIAKPNSQLPINSRRKT